MDTLKPDARRRVMQANRGRTRSERAFASAVWASGVRYLTPDGFRARYGARLPGNPDMLFPGVHLAVFVDGCFWHGCRKCRRYPKTRWAFWRGKFERNRRRDAAVNRALMRAGWKVVRIPEHAIRSDDRRRAFAERLARRLRTMMRQRRG